MVSESAQKSGKKRKKSETEEPLESSLHGFSEDDHEILVRIVKEAQRRGITGTKGSWKEFVQALYRETGVLGPNDPAKRPWNTLADFIATFTAEDDMQMVARVRRWGDWKKQEEELDREDPWPKSPEQKLVNKTRSHPAFALAYRLPSDHEDWECSPRGASSEAEDPPPLLCVDCEMCAVEGNQKELIKVSVVDRNCKVLLSELVKPSKPVLQYKTAITGVTDEDLRSVTFTQKQAQKAVLKLLSVPGTILIGHSLHHDLKALKIEHRRVIDTAMIFSYQGLPSATPALGDLCQSLLKVGFRVSSTVHDSVEDATTPMRLVLHELEHGPTPPLAPPEVKVDKAELSKLFVHRIPQSATKEEIAALFSDDESPFAVQDIFWGPTTGTTFVIFKNPEHANNAFKLLEGEQKQDALGRAQKMVSIGVRKDCVVRKMGCHNGLLYGKVKKADVVSPQEQEIPRKEKKKDDKETPPTKRAKVSDSQNLGVSNQELEKVEKDEEVELDKEKKKKSQGKKSKAERAAKRQAGLDGTSGPVQSSKEGNGITEQARNESGIEDVGEVAHLKRMLKEKETKLQEKEMEVAALQRLVTQLAAKGL